MLGRLFGLRVTDHFVDANKMVESGPQARRQVAK
jgi:hypothetical protein